VKALIRIRKDLTKRKSGKRYDSFYLALSNRLNVPMITVDEKLAQGVVNQPFDVTLARNFRHSSP
jgi:predicted nucleic acid-binding protein